MMLIPVGQFEGWQCVVCCNRATDQDMVGIQGFDPGHCNSVDICRHRNIKDVFSSEYGTLLPSAVTM